MSRDTHHLSQYLPSAEMPDNATNGPRHEVVVDGTMHQLVRQPDGDLNVVDKKTGKRTGA